MRGKKRSQRFDEIEINEPVKSKTLVEDGFLSSPDGILLVLDMAIL